MKTLENELQRLTDVVKKTQLTPVSRMPYDAADEVSKIDREIIAHMATLLLSSKDIDNLLAKKQRIINSVLTRTKYWTGSSDYDSRRN